MGLFLDLFTYFFIVDDTSTFECRLPIRALYSWIQTE